MPRKTRHLQAAGRKPIKHAVVRLNYKGWEDTVLCVKSIQKAHDAPHVIVVDNASPNDSVLHLRRELPGLDLVTVEKNRGFSGGNNVGIQKALRMGAEVVHILNNDTL